MRHIFFAILFLFSTVVVASGLVVQVFSKKCVQGLYSQPPGGPFSVFLFCDDALGANIGIVNTSGGAGPGEIQLPTPMVWNKWDVNNRFWQGPVWATDVTSFAWSTDLKYLYVATSSVYGKGGFYKLNLIERSYIRLLPFNKASRSLKNGYEAKIIRLNAKSGLLTVRSTFFNTGENKEQTETINIR